MSNDHLLLTEERRCGVYCLAPGVSISKLDTSFRQQMYQVEVNGKRLQINASSLAILNYLQEPRTGKEVENFFSLAEGDISRIGKLKQFMDTSIARGLVLSGGDARELSAKCDHPATPSSVKRSPLLIHHTLFSQDLLRPLTSRLGNLFYPPVMALCIAFILAVYASALFHSQMLKLVDSAMFARLSARDWIVFFSLNIFSFLFHELGHSSACTRFGGKHGDIGIGIYIIYPAFYADVTAIWSLPRWQRVVVDVGGIYFHLLYGSACYLLWLSCGSPIFLLNVYAILLAVILNLNPFLRFDGFWLLTDLTGIPRLHRSAVELYTWLWNAPLRRRRVSKPAFLDTHPVIRWCIIGYAIASIGFFVYFLHHILLIFVPFVIHAVPDTAMRLYASVLRGDFGFEFWRTALKELLLVASTWGCSLMLWRLLWKMSQRFGLRRTAERFAFLNPTRRPPAGETPSASRTPASGD